MKFESVDSLVKHCSSLFITAVTWFIITCSQHFFFALKDFLSFSGELWCAPIRVVSSHSFFWLFDELHSPLKAGCLLIQISSDSLSYCNLFCWLNLRIWRMWQPIYLQFFISNLTFAHKISLQKPNWESGIMMSINYSIQHKYGVSIEWYTTRFKKSFHHTVKWSKGKQIEKYINFTIQHTANFGSLSLSTFFHFQKSLE